MKLEDKFLHLESESARQKAQYWFEFLLKNKFDFTSIQHIDMKLNCPVILDHNKNKFSIDFVNDKKNYHKKKSSIKSELIAKAMGSGRYGMQVLDLSAGLAIDAVFLVQLGFVVQMIERNPLIFLALENAIKMSSSLNLKVEFADSLEFLKSQNFTADIIYFDPMFPEKTKSALPRQEMVFFKNLVGGDADAAEVLLQALQAPGVKRVAVKRPLKAPALLKAQNSIQGKLIRYDVYGVKS